MLIKSYYLHNLLTLLFSSIGISTKKTFKCYKVVLQSSVGTLFTWGGECLHYFVENVLRTPNVIKIVQVSQKIWQKHFVLLYLGQCVVSHFAGEQHTD